MIHAQFTLLTNKLKMAPRGQIVSFIFAYVIQMLASPKMRTCTSHCEHSLYLYHPAWLIRHFHIILKSKNTNTRWTGPQPVKPLFCYLTYGSWTANRTDSPYQKFTSQLGMLTGENPLLLSPTNFQASTLRNQNIYSKP